MSTCPFAIQSRRYDSRYPNSRYTGGPDKGVLHSTETLGLPPYAGGATAPHFTVVPDMKRKRVLIYQHFDTARPSRALMNEDGGPQTNNDSVVQVELAGTCSKSSAEKYGMLYWPEAPKWALDGLKKLMRWIEKDRGIPRRTTTRPWLAYGRDARRPGITPASYGRSPARMGPSEWDNFAGWCGHQHVVENDHGDPGNLDIAYLLDASSSPTGSKAKVVTRVGATLAAIAAIFGVTTTQLAKENPGVGPTVRPSSTITLPAGVSPTPKGDGGTIVKPVPAPKPPTTAKPAPSKTPAAAKRTLAKGARGTDVVTLQKRLGIPADGSFGPKTDRAVRDFQYAKGLVVDGRVGPATRAALGSGWAKPALHPGDRGRHVAVVQRLVGAVQDGRYGPETTRKVKAWQKARGIAVDGLFGPQSWGRAYR